MSAGVVLASGALVNGDVPLGEAVAFWILGPISLAGAVGMVLLRNAVHSALSLVATMMSLGTFYLIEQGPFLGLVQIIVYTGAIMILFLFVLMLVGRDSSDSIVEVLRGQRLAAALFGLGFALLVALGVGNATNNTKPVDLDKPNAHGGNVNSIAQLLFTKYLFAFELTSALLIVAAIGAMVLAHIEREGRKPTQKAMARERIRSGRPQPLPGPGVLSTGNAIGTPALLPDGTIAHESVMVGKEQYPPYQGAPGALDTADYDDSEVRS
ncbi:NADH-quinone oxidoreductase subunit J [Jatrophihabitans endophyticus]|uniref:NADH-quinone oxidoreductase subunit J n=1 Tax=Jatrophihabitans endophyticus TaxID=1206085 RepID=UPI001A04224D|nr:NADH-quinone oxidoreductase subunit J [Jatrophihabitans endophyticus]MBE7188135.1 NADH-quinone oxidoreductase subunit J [Jatrophihabitans endophyticus]